MATETWEKKVEKGHEETKTEDKKTDSQNMNAKKRT